MQSSRVLRAGGLLFVLSWSSLGLLGGCGAGGAETTGTIVEDPELRQEEEEAMEAYYESEEGQQILKEQVQEEEL